MARDFGLEEVLREQLAPLSGLSTKAMFGGLAFLLDGNLLCAARHDGMLVRLGAGHDGWALKIDGIAPMHSGSRTMRGWVRAAPEVYADDNIRQRLIEAALHFVRTLPPK